MIFGCMIAALVFAASCENNNESSTEMANEANEEMLDSMNKEKMEDDAEFAVKAANGGMMEVEMGKVAMMNSSNPEIKKFGEKMVNDHGKANDELKAIAANKNITLPPNMSDDMMQKMNDMKEKKGKDFDKAYVDMMVDDHKEDIDAFRDEANNGNDPDIKAFASKTLPTLEEHQSMINAIQDKMK